MKITLVLNRDAGTLRALDAKAVGEELAEIFRAEGHDVDARGHRGRGRRRRDRESGEGEGHRRDRRRWR